MAGQRLNAFRLLGLTVALSASVLMLISSQLPWVRTTSPMAFNYWINIRLDNSGALDVNAIKVVIVAALAVAALAVMSLIPYLRVLCAVVVVIGGVCIALALGVMSEINRPDTSNLVGHIVGNASQRGPGTGIYVLIAGSTLAIISGALTMLTPRTAPPRYPYGMAPYDARGVRVAAPRWRRERGRDAADTAPVPVAGWSAGSLAEGAAGRHATLYAIMGLVIPGLPALLIREDKVIGAAQLGIWMVCLTFALILSISLLVWPAVAIWSAATGYRDAQRWNRAHGILV